MTKVQRDRLRSIRTFVQLRAYLRDELEWPIDEGTPDDDLTFDWSGDDLGLKEDELVDIKEIKQLRPLQSGQPWGIFFINFEKKRLPIVILRRILNALVMKKRASANKSQQAAWKQHDLLFISAYGEDSDRQITFAHFSEPAGERTDTKPTLRVLGWDDNDTNLKLDDVSDKLHEKLTWPADTKDLKAWRQRWSEAFELRHRQVIDTAQELAQRLAELAQRIRNRAQVVLALESEKGALRTLMKGFQTALIHDLDEKGFADMYAQTITYGLFSAAVSRTVPGEGTVVVQEDIAAMVPVTNPFLKEMLESFLKAGGRKGKLDFDELGIQEVVDLLRDPKTRLDAVLRDFGNKTRGEDPVIHFYEHFLSAYNKQLKIQRGVFYTPQPVVSYIVRSVHELLQTEFGLADGLADTATWSEMLRKHPELTLPMLTDDLGKEYPLPNPDTEPFVQILDPATGTATFLVEVIEVIHKHLSEKWKQNGAASMPGLPPLPLAGEGRGEGVFRSFADYWNAYIPRALLPRLHAFELMMAPYAIAHMKIGLKLAETGYGFGSKQRAGIYLTNALEPWVKQLPFIGFEALAHEAEVVNKIKRNKRFTVIIGNPPYSKASQNLGEQFLDLIERFRFFSGERIREPGAILFERDINNDYVKFLGLNRNLIELVRAGVMGVITSSSYLDGKNFRGVRDGLAASFNELCVLNLHGDSRSGALARKGLVDENVFDIETGVSILLAARTASLAQCSEIFYSEAVGTYDKKSALLLDGDPGLDGKASPIDARRYKSFLPSESFVLDEYLAFGRIDEAYGLAVDGIKTSRDGLVIANTASSLASKIQAFMSFTGSVEEMEQTFGISVSKWDYKSAQKHLRRHFSEKRIFRLAYRPFDFRFIYYDSELVFSNREAKMSHLIRGENLALVCASRLSAKGFNHILPADCLVEMKYASHDTNSRVFPALLYEDSLLSGELQPNIGQAAKAITGGLLSANDWMEFNAAALAILNSSKYRTRYFDEIKNDFPSIPPITYSHLRQSLAKLGQRLIRAQLLNAVIPDAAFPFTGKVGEKIVAANLEGDRLYISDSGFFGGVSSEVFEFNIAGYQVCKNWVNAGSKSGIQRKGTALTSSQAQIFRRVLFGIEETINVRTLVDNLLGEYVDW